MNDWADEDASTLQETPRDGQAVSALLRTTGRRIPVPPDRVARVRSSVKGTWRAAVERRRARRRWAWGSAALAAAVAGLFAVWPAGRDLGIGRPDPNGSSASALQGPAAPPVVAARIERVVEGAWWKPEPNRTPSMGRRGDEVPVGSELTTEAKGRLALRLLTGHSIRLDAGSAIRMVGPRAIALVRGAVYVDSGGPARGAGAISVHTARGSVRDIGTQFEVRDLGTALHIRVREGKVAIDAAGVALEVEAGHEAELAQDGGRIRRGAMTDATALDWVGTITPMLDVQGRSLQEFLAWAARERGLELRFTSPDLASAAPRIVLNGSIDGMTMDEALASVLMTCRMSHRVGGGALVIQPAPPAARPS